MLYRVGVLVAIADFSFIAWLLCHFDVPAYAVPIIVICSLAPVALVAAPAGAYSSDGGVLAIALVGAICFILAATGAIGFAVISYLGWKHQIVSGNYFPPQIAAPSAVLLLASASVMLLKSTRAQTRRVP